MKQRSRIPRSARIRAFGARACGFGFTGVVNTNKGGKARYRSRMELKYIQLMEESPLVKAFKMEPFAIPYEVRVGSRVFKKKYTPDVMVEFVDGHKEIWEIKMQQQCKFAINQIKWATLTKYLSGSDITFRVMTEASLKTLDYK